MTKNATATYCAALCVYADDCVPPSGNIQLLIVDWIAFYCRIQSLVEWSLFSGPHYGSKDVNSASPYGTHACWRLSRHRENLAAIKCFSAAQLGWASLCWDQITVNNWNHRNCVYDKIKWGKKQFCVTRAHWCVFWSGFLPLRAMRERALVYCLFTPRAVRFISSAS